MDAAPEADAATSATKPDAGEVCREEPAKLGACVMRDVPVSEPVIELSGVVEEIRRDDWACSAGIGAFYNSTPRDVRYRVHVVDGANGLWLGLTLPWSTPLVAVGDRVSVRFVQTSGGLGAPWPGAFELIDADGSLLLWLADDWSAMALAPPPDTTIRDGERVCGGETSCSTFEDRALRFTAGSEVEVLPRRLLGLLALRRRAARDPVRARRYRVRMHVLA